MAGLGEQEPEIKIQPFVKLDRVLEDSSPELCAVNFDVLRIHWRLILELVFLCSGSLGCRKAQGPLLRRW